MINLKDPEFEDEEIIISGPGGETILTQQDIDAINADTDKQLLYGAKLGKAVELLCECADSMDDEWWANVKDGPFSFTIHIDPGLAPINP